MEVTQPTYTTTAVKRNLFSSEEEEKSLEQVICYFFKVCYSLRYLKTQWQLELPKLRRKKNLKATFLCTFCLPNYFIQIKLKMGIF